MELRRNYGAVYFRRALAAYVGIGTPHLILETETHTPDALLHPIDGKTERTRNLLLAHEPDFKGKQF